MSLASDAREALRARPFLHEALRAGVLNYSAAADHLAPALDRSETDREAIAAALRRYESDLQTAERESRQATVRVRRGVETGESPPDGSETLLAVGGVCLTATEDSRRTDGERAAVLATGDVDAAALAAVLNRLRLTEIDVAAAGVAGDALVTVVPVRDRTDALRAVEGALDAVPTR